MLSATCTAWGPCSSRFWSVDLPWHYDTYPEFVEQVAKGASASCAVEHDPDVPEELSRICRQAMARDQANRLEIVEALARSIRRWISESAVDREIAELLRHAEPHSLTPGRAGRGRLEPSTRRPGP